LEHRVCTDTELGKKNTECRRGPLRKLQGVVCDIQKGISRTADSLQFEIVHEKSIKTNLQESLRSKTNQLIHPESGVSSEMNSVNLVSHTYFWTWTLSYIGSDEKVYMCADHCQVQDVQHFDLELKKGRRIPAEGRTPRGDTSALLVQLPFGQNATIRVDIYLWHHHTDEDTLRIKNTFSNSHLSDFERIAKSRQDDLNTSAEAVFNSFAKILPSVPSAIPQISQAATALSVSGEALTLFRNVIKMTKYAVTDTLEQRHTIIIETSRGWDGNFKYKALGGNDGSGQPVFTITEKSAGVFEISDVHFGPVVAKFSLASKSAK